MKACKYIFLILAITLASCSLPDTMSGMGTSSLSFCLKLPETNKSPSSARFISEDAAHVVIYLYRPFDGDLLASGEVPTAEGIDNLKKSAETITSLMSFGTDDSVNYHAGDLTPGTWCVAVGVFSGSEIAWADGANGIAGPDSFVVFRNFELVSGENSLSLPLGINDGILTNQGDSPDIQNLASEYKIDVTSEDLAGGTVVYAFQNMPGGELTLINDFSADLADTVDVEYYDSEGNRLSLNDENQYTGEFASGDELYLRVSPSEQALAAGEVVRITPVLTGDQLTFTIERFILGQLTLTVDGCLLPIASELQVYLYQSDEVALTDDPMDTDIQSITDSAVYMNLSQAYAYVEGDAPTIELSDIEPGEWKLIVGSFEDGDSGWTKTLSDETTEVSSVVAGFYDTAVTIAGGENALSANLLINEECFQDGLVGFGGVESEGSLVWNGDKDYIPMLLTGCDSTYDMYMSDLTDGTYYQYYLDSFEYYSMDGSLVSATYSEDLSDGCISAWTYNTSDGTDTMLALLYPNQNNIASMDVTVSYTTNTPNVVDLSIGDYSTNNTTLDLTVSGPAVDQAGQMEIIFYKAFDGDALTLDAAPTDDLLSSAGYGIYFDGCQTYFADLSVSDFSNDAQSYLLEGLSVPPGIWNVIIAAFDDIDDDPSSTWDTTFEADDVVDGDYSLFQEGSTTYTVADCLSYSLLEGVVVDEAGGTTLSAGMKFNFARYYADIITEFNLQNYDWSDLGTTGDYGAFDVTTDTYAMIPCKMDNKEAVIFTGLTPGVENRLYLGTEAAAKYSSGEFLINIFDDDGNQLEGTYGTSSNLGSSGDVERSYIAVMPEAGQERLTVTASTLSGSNFGSNEVYLRDDNNKAFSNYGVFNSDTEVWEPYNDNGTDYYVLGYWILVGY